MFTRLPTYETIAIRPTRHEFEDSNGKVVGVSSVLDDLFECSLCGAAVRNQELHTEWHRSASVRSMFGV